jgi:hypothetical protein
MLPVPHLFDSDLLLKTKRKRKIKGGDIIRTTGTNIASMPTIGAEDMIAFVKRNYYYYLFLLAG